MSESWFPLLAMVEQQDGIPLAESVARLPEQPGSDLSSFAPSLRLRQTLQTLRQLLHEELGEHATGKRHWLLLERSGELSTETFEVAKVLEEMRERFQSLRDTKDESGTPDLESYLREKMRQLGLHELPPGPLLPDLQREALRGIGVGLGSQMAQLLGRLAGWHGDVKPPLAAAKTAREPKNVSSPARLLRLEVSSQLASSKQVALQLRTELSRARKHLSTVLGWEISVLSVALAKDDPDARWKLFLRGAEVAQGPDLADLLSRFESTLLYHAADLLTFEEFEAMTRQPGCRAVVRELRAQGLEKALLWTLMRHRLSQGLGLVDPLTLFERLLEASVVSLDHEHLLESVLSA